MGLDMYIDKCRKPKIVNGKREYEEREEVCYWRKFWGLLQEGLPFKYAARNTDRIFICLKRI